MQISRVVKFIRKGEKGDGVVSTEIRYVISLNGTTPPLDQSNWTESIPTLIKGRYLWTRTILTYSDGSKSYSYTVSYIAKDGEKGEDGKDGANYLPPVWWDSEVKYVNSGFGIPVVKLEDGTTLGYSVYALTADESPAGYTPSGYPAIWRLMESSEYMFLQEAYIEKLQAELVTAEKINALDITSRRLLAINSAGTKIAGINESDNGAYIQYYPSGRIRMILDSGALRYYSNDSNNTYRGTVRLGDDNRIWFENCALQHQAPTGPFLASSIFARGTFGSYTTNALVVWGNYAYFFPNGLTGAGVYATLTQKTSSTGVTYHEIPLYGSSGDASGMPVDLVILRASATYRYELEKIAGKRVIVVNAYDQNSNIYIFSNGQQVQLHGGDMAEFVNISGFMTPDPGANVVGRGWLFGGKNDNQWT